MSGFLFALIFDIESILMMIDAFLRDFIMVQKYVMVGVAESALGAFQIFESGPHCKKFGHPCSRLKHTVCWRKLHACASLLNALHVQFALAN